MPRALALCTVIVLTSSLLYTRGVSLLHAVFTITILVERRLLCLDDKSRRWLLGGKLRLAPPALLQTPKYSTLS